MSPYQPRIAIVGGGPSGLTVGLLLHKRNIPFTIFELRSKPMDEELAKPVGMLDMHEESGLAALKECNLLDEFKSHTSVCSEFQIIANKEGNIIYTDDGGLESRPEISRNSLTKLLLDQLPADAVKWEHKLTSSSCSITVSGSMEIQLDFGIHGRHTFDLVVGADGTWSRVRNLLTDTKPQYAGFQYLMLAIRQVTKRYPKIAEYVGTGSFTSLANRHGIMCQRALQDSALIYAFLSTPDEHFGTTSGITNGTPAEAKEKLLNDNALFGQFGPRLKELVQTACDEETNDGPDSKLVVRSLYTLPAGHTWEYKPGVTLIGDASHVMLPFAGEGVNVAMWDALDVSRAIIKSYEARPQDAASFQDVLEPLIKEFEVRMADRAKEKAEEAYKNSQLMLGSEDGATAMAEWMRAAIQQAETAKVSND
ncbi:uncharacterized protein Z518_04310 [Rhinocladiella mackenziei CBS 650.93]|uniref:FAD-binding domain-containing protein n=1 Tax=Rhinocladiella mackenziei CBS 650.93 TaxID=1442369 RepID=A0A0D2IKV4_9EURO|nr:uncharacterized protein Z518_04310 [Rhinocladiella mackenziei CBS 650.93]KIX06334.1 hypothetical protein Z518_04310 [Rhinocladiella mackenziei CBS 650.93]